MKFSEGCHKGLVLPRLKMVRDTRCLTGHAENLFEQIGTTGNGILSDKPLLVRQLHK